MFRLSTIPQKYLDVIETIFNEFDGALVIDELGKSGSSLITIAEQAGYPSRRYWAKE